MNRMWVRFGVTFGIFALLGPLLLVTVGFLTLQTGVLRTFLRNELTSEGGLIDQLAGFYTENQGWARVDTLLSVYESFLPSGPENDIRFELYFMDEGRNVLYGSDAAALVLTQDERAYEVLPVTVEGRTRGYLSVVQVRRDGTVVDPNLTRPFLVGQISSALVSLGTFAALFGVAAGLLVSRAMARPLGRLAATARRLGKRDFSARAEVKGSDEMRAVARAFNDMAHDLEQAETVRRNLVADVAHELRTPLTVLQANLQALSDGVYALTKDEVERLLHQTQLLTHLVDELRELSLAEARQLRLQVQPTDLAELVAHTAGIFQPTADQQGVTLVVDAPQAVVIDADGGRLQQVMNNLMHNALRHTPAGGCITLAAHLDATGAHLTVSDTGSGIAPEHLPHIFDRFYRADRSRSRETGGTGLGLAIAKAIVELHGGSISAQSSGVAGEGATFHIRL